MGNAFRLYALAVSCGLFFLTTTKVAATDLNLAPPSFETLGKKVVPVDFKNQTLDLVFDVSQKRAKAVSVIDFVVREQGRPMFDMRSIPTSITLDQSPLPQEAFVTVSAPDNVTKFVMLDKEVSPSSSHRMEIRYDILPEHVTFTEDGASIGFFMSDVGSDRDFLEQYAPANLEFDAFPMQVQLKVLGSGEHKLFTNGKAIETQRNSWKIQFPNYYTSSSFYLHLTQKSLVVAEETFQGIQKLIPITVYAKNESLTSQAMSKAKAVLKELEADYGTFAHEKVVIYVTSEDGGMEYCGATTTSLNALGHELTHSYFARGVMPANGNSGWIDEAIATWRDNDYPTATESPTRPPVNLGGFSAYRRTTPWEAYEEGAQLMSEFDYLFQNNHREGLKPVLQHLFSAKQHQVITTDFFSQFLETLVEIDLKSIFQKYVYGKGGSRELHEFSVVPKIPRMTFKNHHPRKYTHSELLKLR